MRRTVSASLALLFLVPSVAQASPFAIRSQDGTETGAAPELPPADSSGGVATDAPTTQSPSSSTPPPATSQSSSAPPPVVAPKTDAPPATTAPPAEPEGPAPEDEADDLGDPTEEGLTSEEEVTLESEREAVSPGAYNAHGLGFRGGLTIVPTWILSQFLASHTNALCRGENIGGFAGDRGITKQGGCNWFAGGEYTYRKSRVFDIVAAAGYQRAKTPDGIWLDKDEWGDSCTGHDPDNGCDLAAGDYTEVDFGFVFIEADFIGRYPVVRTPDVEIGIGGGGGIGVGILVGQGVYQTPLGPGTTDTGAGNPTCNRLEDYQDLTKCTPMWFDDPDLDQDGDGNATGDPLVEAPDGGPLRADCSRDKCDVNDLKALGSRRKQGDVPPVIPVVNLIATVRFIIKDSFGINLTGGFQTGFYFGGSLGYFFGGGGK
jgi:hypothetical protein